MECLSPKEKKLVQVLLKLDGCKRVDTRINSCQVYNLTPCNKKQTKLLYHTMSHGPAILARACSSHIEYFLEAGWREL